MPQLTALTQFPGNGTRGQGCGYSRWGDKGGRVSERKETGTLSENSGDIRVTLSRSQQSTDHARIREDYLKLGKNPPKKIRRNSV